GDRVTASVVDHNPGVEAGHLTVGHVITAVTGEPDTGEVTDARARSREDLVPSEVEGDVAARDDDAVPGARTDVPGQPGALCDRQARTRLRDEGRWIQSPDAPHRARESVAGLREPDRPVGTGRDSQREAVRLGEVNLRDDPSGGDASDAIRGRLRKP